MNPIEDLTKEHGPVKLMLRVLEKINEQIASGKSVAIDDLNSGIVFLKEFADKCHHGKEENLLFPMMKKNSIQKEVELINILLLEHAEGRGYIAKMVEAIGEKEKNPSRFAEVFRDNAKRYIALLDQHIDKENTILFPSAKHSIPESQLKELEDGFENVENNIIGPGRHKELHGIINKLKGIYL